VLIPGPRKILVIRLRYIGDVLLSTPCLTALRKKFPEAKICYLAENSAAPALENNPDISETIVCSRSAGIIEQLHLVRRLRGEKFDLVFDFLGNPRSALYTFFTGSRCRVGFNVRIRKIFYNAVVRPFPGEDEPDAIDVYLNALKFAGIEPAGRKTVLRLKEEETGKAEEFLRKLGVKPGNPVAALNPGGSRRAKRWPIENFARLADMLSGDGIKVMIFSGPDEAETREKMSALMKSRPVFNEYADLRATAALIQKCSCFVSNDTGPMHIGPAVGTPTIAIFGSSNPKIWFPYSEEQGHRAIKKYLHCWPCFQDDCDRIECLKQIKVEEVYKKAKDAITGS